MLAAGQVIDRRYRLVAPLGSGGMGIVWEARHVDVGTPVALKFLRCRGASTDRTKRRFVREARATMRVEHPNVLRLFDAFRMDDDTPVLAMELLEGETLAARLERVELLDWPTFAPILTGIVAAVEAAHQAGIIHRDLKPSNVFLARDPRSGTPPATELVRVLDFGVSKLVDGEGAEGGDTESGATLGTPQYMAPEQALGDKTLTFAVDVWAVGVMTYECLSGGRPVEGDSLGQVVRQLLQGSITPLEHVRPDLPLHVMQMVGRMLAELPKDRPSIEEIRKWLEAGADEGVVAHRRRAWRWGRTARRAGWALGFAALFGAPVIWRVTQSSVAVGQPTVRLNAPPHGPRVTVPPAEQEALPAPVQPVGIVSPGDPPDRAPAEIARPRTSRPVPHPKPSAAPEVPEPGHEFAKQPAVPGGMDEAPF
jgi:hypothetical protein